MGYYIYSGHHTHTHHTHILDSLVSSPTVGDFLVQARRNLGLQVPYLGFIVRGVSSGVCRALSVHLLKSSQVARTYSSGHFISFFLFRFVARGEFLFPYEFPSLCSIFDHTDEAAQDVTYFNWLSMVRAGVVGLEYFTPEHNKWRQVRTDDRITTVVCRLWDG